MSSEIDQLIEELKTYISLRGGRLTLKELMEWSEEQELSILMLDMIVNEMVKRGIVKASKERELIDIGTLLTVELPKELRIAYRSDGEEKARVEEKKRKTQRRRPTNVALITEFIAKEKRPKRVKKREVVVKPKTKVSKGALVERVKQTKPSSTVRESPVSSDLERVIAYLNNYRSVGEIRFLLDLKAMGIKDPSEVLENLLELGYVTRSPLGVINATDKLPKVTKDKKISEILFGA